MPVLKKYSDDYHKDGYYVHAPIDGLGHPLPLQTPDITAEIYHELGYSRNDNIPNELAWELYGVGLHWTENTGANHLSEDELESTLASESGPNFTDEQIEAILSIVESYSGGCEDEVEALVDELKAKEAPQQHLESGVDKEENYSRMKPEGLMKQLEVDSGIAHFQDAIDRSLSDDEIQVIEEVATPDEVETINGVTFGMEKISSREDYFEQLAQCKNVAKSLNEFSDAGSLDLWRVVPTPPSIGYSYETDLNTLDNAQYERLQHLVVSDHRWNTDINEDLRITVTKAGVGVRFLIHDEHISEFTVWTPQDQEVGSLEREAMEWAATDGITADQMMHHSLGTVIDATSLIEDLVGDIPSYHLCPVEPFASA